MIAPILDEVSKDYDGKLRIAKMNVDENRDVLPSTASAAFPTLMLFKDGQLAATKVGALSKAQLTAVHRLSPIIRFNEGTRASRTAGSGTRRPPGARPSILPDR
jgi:thioredoxin-like negative regulator of GroEL